jgi:F0F1-type ATP synthase assembly protein I
VASLAMVGWVLVVCVVAGTMLGQYLDRSWNTSPWLLLSGALLGTTAGVLYIWRSVKRTS